MSHRFRFNTNRPYSVDGQIVHVDYDPVEGKALFADVTRSIDGFCFVSKGVLMNKTGIHFVRTQVMNAYDTSCYATSRESKDFLDSVRFSEDLLR